MYNTVLILQYFTFVVFQHIQHTVFYGTWVPCLKYRVKDTSSDQTQCYLRENPQSTKQGLEVLTIFYILNIIYIIVFYTRM